LVLLEEHITMLHGPLNVKIEIVQQTFAVCAVVFLKRPSINEVNDTRNVLI